MYLADITKTAAMQTTKTVQQVIAPPPTHMVGNGFKVHNFFPTLSEDRMSPFFLLDYNAKWIVPPSETPRGVGVHPHRGLETVTIAYSGRIAHHDSVGHADVIGQGEVQWMTAGAGILHKEYHEKEFSRTGGIMQMVQLWVNLPAKDKFTPPTYQPITRKEIGIHALPNDAGEVEVIAGEYCGTKGPARVFTPIELYNIHLKANGSATVVLPANYNTSLLVIEGDVVVNKDTKTPENHLALFNNHGEMFEITASVASKILIMSGLPIKEPIASRGPFLMNTMEEIRQAYEDYHNGKFGYLED
jgi:hypothetical protein